MENLTLIQNELKAPKNQYNSFGKYKYRSCEDILEAVKPLLKKHKCSLYIEDSISEVGGIAFVESRCVFNDGENKIISTAQAGIDPNRKGMDISQSFGSSSSYARKYALNGLFLIDDTKDADATNDHGKATPQPNPTPQKTVVKSGSKEFLTLAKWIVEGRKTKSGQPFTIEKAKEAYSISEAVENELKDKIQVLSNLL